ncbi:hypothetical protein [Methylobacterium durans]|uniref:Sulfur globule protein n=1 Tax=Methylobacterium durans TaxID=2202825 RepID=A0A2U8W1U2_9HYPH|nr:hypothetical protein [Methylobacterium durans]AWN39618.1 hypothetical protein DK389_02570 [Methylobacterium durans]
MGRLITLTAALALAAAALGASEASARGFGRGGFGHGGFGHHHGFGRGFGWGPRYVAIVPAYVRTCRVTRFIDADGDLVVRKICD